MLLKQKNIIATGIVAVCVAILVAACTHKPAPVTPANLPNNNNTAGIKPEDTALCFERDILPIFRANCAKSGCHDAVTARDGFVFTSYETITSKEFTPGDADDTELYEKITEDNQFDRMPPVPNAALTQQQIAMIGRWINEGAKNTKGCSPYCDSNTFTYSMGIKPIMETNCRGCHNASVAMKGVNLDNYNGVYNAAVNGKLLDAIKHNAGVLAMPYNGIKLSDCKIRQVEKWVAAGAQNN